MATELYQRSLNCKVWWSFLTKLLLATLFYVVLTFKVTEPTHKFISYLSQLDSKV